MFRPILSVAILVFACCGAYGQTFEVASIKPSQPDNNGFISVLSSGGPGTRDPGLFTCRNCSLSNLVARAYDLKAFQLPTTSGLDSGSQRFDIIAKVPGGTTKEQFRLMQQNLLAERFGLKVHFEKKEMQIYELTIGKNGPKMKESVDSAAGQDSVPSPFPPGPPKLDPGPPKLDKEGYPVLPPGGRGMAFVNGRARMQASKETMEQLAGMLSGQLGKPVTDATGLKGKYDFTLSWSAGGMMGPMGRGGPLAPSPEIGAGPAPVFFDPDSGPTLIGAVQEQLGLKLEQKKGLVEILVVDHVEKAPTDN